MSGNHDPSVGTIALWVLVYKDSKFGQNHLGICSKLLKKPLSQPILLLKKAVKKMFRTNLGVVVLCGEGLGIIDCFLNLDCKLIKIHTPLLQSNHLPSKFNQGSVKWQLFPFNQSSLQNRLISV